MTLQEFHTGMRDHFGLKDAGRFLDRVMLMIPKVSLDVFKFDDWLHERFGEYESNGYSMATVIEKEFGAAARAFCKKAIE